ncbi:MAG: hypothetical protein DU429_02985 [Candidatus Tokpelaia sp.]|nr:MAG: hypothetical protein DU430_05740 [Candidatus Tokpelaia sp.]KAA6207431.1 MAG: hypothetical protein DU429_02985 [Candidatus Tokpelaia sp.]
MGGLRLRRSQGRRYKAVAALQLSRQKLETQSVSGARLIARQDNGFTLPVGIADCFNMRDKEVVSDAEGKAYLCRCRKKKPRRRGLVFQLYIRKYNNIRRIIHFYSPYLN